MTDVELTLVPDDDPRMFLPFVTVEINGVRVEALLDSGASRSQIVNQAGVVAKNGFTPASAGAFGSQTAATGSATVSFHVGGLDAGTVEVTVVPPGLPGHGNLIGQDVLGRFRCIYRLANGLMVLDAEPPGETHSIYLGERRHKRRLRHRRVRDGRRRAFRRLRHPRILGADRAAPGKPAIARVGERPHLLDAEQEHAVHRVGSAVAVVRACCWLKQRALVVTEGGSCPSWCN